MASDDGGGSRGTRVGRRHSRRRLAVLGICFVVCALLLVGLPPLSGFVAKLALLAALFAPAEPARQPAFRRRLGPGRRCSSFPAWRPARACRAPASDAFWAPIDAVVPRVLLLEIAPVAVLLLLCLALTVEGGPVMRYMDDDGARRCMRRDSYVDDVLSAAVAARRAEATDEPPAALSAADGVAARHVALAQRTVARTASCWAPRSPSRRRRWQRCSPAKPQVRRWHLMPQARHDRPGRHLCAPISPWPGSFCRVAAAGASPASS